MLTQEYSKQGSPTDPRDGDTAVWTWSAEVLGQDVGMVLRRDTQLDTAWWGGKDGAVKAGLDTLSVRHRAGAGQALELWEALGRELCEYLGGKRNL